MTSQLSCQPQHSPQNYWRKTKISSSYMLAFLPITGTQCERFSKRLHQHWADIKHGDRTHGYKSPLVSALLTTGGRFSSEPPVEEYPSLVASTIFSSRKCRPRPPTHSGGRTKCARGSDVCPCVKEPSPNPTQREKKKYSKVVQHDKAISSLGKPVVRQNTNPGISSIWATTPPKH